MVGVPNNSGLALLTQSMSISPSQDGVQIQEITNDTVFLQAEAPLLGSANESTTLIEKDVPNVTITKDMKVEQSLELKAVFMKALKTTLMGSIYSSNNLSGPITAWIEVNGKQIKNTGAINSVIGVDDYGVLTFSFTLKFKKNDRLSFGVRSDSRTSVPTEVCKGKITSAGVYAPSLNVTALKR